MTTPTFRDYWDALFGRTKEFARVTHEDGGWFICTPMAAAHFIETEGDCASEYAVTRVYLTERQYEMMPEFAGF